MRPITRDQKRALERIYTHVVETGRWPGAQALRRELFKAYRFKLEDIARQMGSDLIVCNDVSVDTTTCFIHVPALRHIDAAAEDRRLVGKLVAWLDFYDTMSDATR